MTLSQGYQMTQAATHRQPCLDFPYADILIKDTKKYNR